MIETIINAKKDCTGCHACANICIKKCISMIPDEEGFLYPKTDYNVCVKCGKCIEVCPIVKKPVGNNVPVAYACINKNEHIRNESSSGGIFTLIAEQALESGSIVFGAGFDTKFEVVHSFCDSKQELYKFRGSKYVQSKIGDTFNQVKSFLQEDRNVLFVGTPCQIGGLKSYLSKPYENLLCIDFICHGVPSPTVWEKYLEYQEEKNGGAVKSIFFRNKRNGWKNFGISIEFENNRSYYQTLHKDLYMRAFLKDICLRPSCHECAFKSLQRHSDITLADFWGIQDMVPEMDDDKGTSLVFINTEVGRKILGKISDQISYKEVDINQAVKHNPAAIQSATYNPRRSDFFMELESKAIDKIISKYCIDKTHVRVIRVIKRMIYKSKNILKK